MRAGKAMMGSGLLVCFLSVGLFAADVAPLVPGKKEVTVFLVGNSYTKHGKLFLANVLSSLSRSSNSTVRIKATPRYASNCTLERHWRACEKLLSKRKFDLIVVQEHSQRPLLEPEKTEEFAKKFADKAQATGQKLALFMTWAPKKEPEKTARLEAVYKKLGASLNVPVVPIGLAWAEAMKKNSKIPIYSKKDGQHPALAGFYFNACILYAAITGKSPVGLGDGSLTDVAEADRKVLQKIAWDTVQKWAQAAKAPADAVDPK